MIDAILSMTKHGENKEGIGVIHIKYDGIFANTRKYEGYSKYITINFNNMTSAISEIGVQWKLKGGPSRFD